jgi:hypothetical protein
LSTIEPYRRIRRYRRAIVGKAQLRRLDAGLASLHVSARMVLGPGAVGVDREQIDGHVGMVVGLVWYC